LNEIRRPEFADIPLHRLDRILTVREFDEFFHPHLAIFPWAIALNFQKPFGRVSGPAGDKVFELVEGNLSNEKRTDLYQIAERFKNDPEDHGWALRVAKAICLLEFIRDLPRTEANLSAVLVDEVECKGKFDEFMGRAEEYSTAIRPFFPDLVSFPPDRRTAPASQ